MSQHEIVVLKFGSSILADSKHITQAIHEAYQYLRKGQKVLAVVSALGSTTDDLLAASQAVLNDPLATPDPKYLAELLATGEITATALFALALDNAGIPVAKLDHSALTTEGDLLDASPLALDQARIDELFDHYAVVVLPGFIGKNKENALTLLGRGGSDFTAVFAANRLQAKACVLYKDTAGIYDRDPNNALGVAARQYQYLHYQDGLKLEYPVVQHKALAFAQQQKFGFFVRAIDNAQGTEIGSRPSKFYEDSIAAPKLKVALIGLGTVGLGVYKHLTDAHSGFEVVGIAVKNLAKHQHHHLPKGLLTDNLEALLNKESDVVIELMGGVDVAHEVIKTALQTGRHVITANKALLAEQGVALNKLAETQGVKILFSASVAGAVPVLEKIAALKTRGKAIKSIKGIFNGTCNFILDKIQEGFDFKEALSLAQKAGFAEADPSLDINGTDAAQKLCIVARSVFGVEPDKIEFSGIENIDLNFVRAPGQVVRLIGECQRQDNKVYATLKPKAVPIHDPLAGIKANHNCALIETAEGELIKIQGKGAGRWPTAVSVYADLLELKQSLGAYA